MSVEVVVVGVVSVVGGDKSPSMIVGLVGEVGLFVVPFSVWSTSLP